MIKIGYVYLNSALHVARGLFQFVLEKTGKRFSFYCNSFLNNFEPFYSLWQSCDRNDVPLLFTLWNRESLAVDFFDTALWSGVWSGVVEMNISAVPIKPLIL